MHEYLLKENVDKAIAEWSTSGEWKRRNAVELLEDRINDIRYEDVRPIVFCKDCDHRGGKHSREECTLLTQENGLPKIWFKTNPYGFCVHGKPKS